MLSSHSRAYGMPPKEPWEYGEPFMVVFAASAKSAQGLVCLPSDNVLHRITLPRGKGDYRLAANPLAGRSTLTVRMYNAAGK